MAMNRISQLVLRYLIFVVIPYFIAEKISTYFWANANEDLKQAIGKKKLTTKMNLDKLSDSSEEALGTRGGSYPITVWLTKLIICDLGLKVAIVGGVSATIWGDNADNAAALIIKYSKTIAMAPGKKFVRIVNKLRKINPNYPSEIKEILLDRELGNEEKWEMLKVKIEYALKNLTGRKRRQFILTIIALIAFTVGTNFVLLAWFMERLRSLLGNEDNLDGVQEYLIEIYQEYNAPLPEELATILPDELITKIRND